MIEQLEEQLEQLFIRQGIGSWLCPDDHISGAKQAVERWKKTTRYVSQTDDVYLEALKLRLKQGGVEI